MAEIEFFSSDTGIWNTFAFNSYQGYYGPLERNGFYWNGSIHGVKKGSVRFCSYEYDSEKNNFQVFDMSPNRKGFNKRSLRYFGESNGHLHLIFVRTCFVKKFQVLERDRETLKWSVKYRVHICHLLSKFPEICVKRSNDYVEYAFSILCVFKGEKEEDSALVLTIPGKVVSYNLHNKTSKVLCELPSQVIDTSGHHYCTGFNFIETLASV